MIKARLRSISTMDAVRLTNGFKKGIPFEGVSYRLTIACESAEVREFDSAFIYDGEHYGIRGHLCFPIFPPEG